MVLLPLAYTPPPQLFPKWFINKVFLVGSTGCATYYLLTSSLMNFTTGFSYLIVFLCGTKFLQTASCLKKCTNKVYQAGRNSRQHVLHIPELFCKCTGRLNFPNLSVYAYLCYPNLAVNVLLKLIILLWKCWKVVPCLPSSVDKALLFPQREVTVVTLQRPKYPRDRWNVFGFRRKVFTFKKWGEGTIVGHTWSF